MHKAKSPIVLKILSHNLTIPVYIKRSGKAAKSGHQAHSYFPSQALTISFLAIDHKVRGNKPMKDSPVIQILPGGLPNRTWRGGGSPEERPSVADSVAVAPQVVEGCTSYHTEAALLLASDCIATKGPPLSRIAPVSCESLTQNECDLKNACSLFLFLFSSVV